MVIGIGGVSRAGKSTLADELARIAWKRKWRSKVLHQDVFVHPEGELPMIEDHVDWEHPDSINWDRLRGELIRQMAEFDLIIVEGLLAFWDPILADHYDRSLFLHIPEAVFRIRKAEDLRWGKEPDWYMDHIWNSYLTFGHPEHAKSRLIHISGEEHLAGRMLEAFLHQPGF